MYVSSLWQNLSTVPKILTLLHLYLDLDFWPFEKKLNLGYNFWIKKIRYSLWQDLSVCTKRFNPVSVTLTLSFDLLLNKINLGHNFWTKTDKAFILHVYSSWQDLSGSTKIFQLMTLTVTFDLILRNWKCLITIISSQVYISVGD